MKDIKVIAVDADDTLWDNQSYYDRAGDVFSETLLEYGQADWLQDRLFETEIANMPLLGYGAKSVCISMMETAMEVSGGKVSATQLDHILKSAKSLLEIPATPLPGVAETLEELRKSGRYRLVLFTKGDLLDQRRKLRLGDRAHALPLKQGVVALVVNQMPQRADALPGARLGQRLLQPVGRALDAKAKARVLGNGNLHECSSIVSRPLRLSENIPLVIL